jgi:NAD(P)-dependent dehydrogenase (short-subunit alcohol dehydrogenase family)
VSHFDGLDILVNNAGIFDMVPIVEITRESYRNVSSQRSVVAGPTPAI